ncbi:DUF6257 family protein [Streptomyces sp. NPDC056632]|uniref:DUF6257 family protein n=1 Tax=Streptomyces sp. NPDC056632 TaxID=3345884 RepID=UPI00369B1641
MASKKNEQDPNYPQLTVGENARIAWNVARMAKRCMAGENADRSDLERNVNRILDRAHKRAEKNAKKGK